MAEAAAGDKGLAMEHKVRGCCRSLLSTRGCCPCATVFIYLGARFYLLQQQEEEGAAAPSVSGVYFICPLTGAVVRKDQKEKQLREAIQAVSASFQLLWVPSSRDLANPPPPPCKTPQDNSSFPVLTQQMGRS